MYLTEFFDSVKQIKNGWKPYANWEKEQEDNEAKRKVLAKNVAISPKELNEAAHYGRTLIDIINTMDTYSINKSQDAELLVKGALQLPLSILSMVLPFAGAMFYVKKKHKISPKEVMDMSKTAMNRLKSVEINGVKGTYGKLVSEAKASLPENKALLPIFLIAGVVSGLMSLAGLIFGHSYSKYLTKQASRIARYQSREEKLKDPRNFVVYDTDQINLAKEIVKDMENPNKPDAKKSLVDIKGSVASVQGLMKDKVNYEKWKEEHKKAENDLKNVKMSEIPAEQLNEAKKYQQSILGAIKHIEISSQNYVNNVDLAMRILFVANATIGVITGHILGKILPKLQNAGVIPKAPATGKAPMITRISEQIVKGAHWMTPIAILFAAMPVMVGISKEVAKIGRFKAKQELLNDPRNFIAYTDEQMDSVKDVKAEPKPKKGLVERFKDQIKFLFQLKKDYNEYEDYNKTTRIEEEKLDLALKQVPLKEGQLEKAKSLQKKVFTSFEKMDEKAQRYADDSEGAAEMVDDIAGKALDAVGFGGSGIAWLAVKDRFKAGGLAAKLKYGSIVAIPLAVYYVLSSMMQIYSVKVKQKAVRIGLMEAMDDLKDPRKFVDESVIEKLANNNPKPELVQAK